MFVYTGLNLGYFTLFVLGYNFILKPNLFSHTAYYLFVNCR